MSKLDLLNNINQENMSKSEAIDHLLQIKRRIVPLSYNFYKLEDGYYYGYKDKFRGDYFNKLTDEEAEICISSEELRNDFLDGKLAYFSGWSYKF